MDDVEDLTEMSGLFLFVNILYGFFTRKDEI